MFCNTVKSTRAVEHHLNNNGIRSVSLHGELPVELRITNYKRFRDRNSNILVSSDLAARGLDFPFLRGVYNFDFPSNINDYIHRAGRAGRIGQKGTIVSYYNSKESSLVEEIQNSYDKKLPQIGN